MQHGDRTRLARLHHVSRDVGLGLTRRALWALVLAGAGGSGVLHGAGDRALDLLEGVATGHVLEAEARAELDALAPGGGGDDGEEG